MGFISFLESSMDNFSYGYDYKKVCETLEIWDKGITEGQLDYPNEEMLLKYMAKEGRLKKKMDTLVFLSACMNFPRFSYLAINIVKTHDLKTKCKKQFDNIFELKSDGLVSRAKELYNS